MKTHWFKDIIAGLTGAVAGAPQAMGFALIAGISPIYGLYGAIVPTIIAALVGSSRYMTVAPTNALALVVGSTLGMFSGPAQIDRLIVLSLLIGIFQLTIGLLRLGDLTRFVSNAVMTGFITGAGLLIIMGQLRYLNGYDTEGGTVLARFADWLLHLPQSDPQTTVVGIGSLLVILVLRRTRFKNIATLTAIVLATLVVVGFEWTSVQLVRDISSIPSGLPGFSLPDITLIPEMASAALAMAVLASVQSAAITQTVPEPDGSIPDVSREFAGHGLANVAGSFFQGMPAGGSLSRTAVNISAGARTRWANVFAGVSIGLALIAFGGLIEQVTLAALAAQLIVAAASLLRLDHIRMAWRVNWTARLSMVITFLSTLLLPLEFSIYIGVLLSLGLYIYTSAVNVHVSMLVPTGDGHYRQVPVPDDLPDNAPVVISVHGHLYFAAIKRLEDLLPTPGACVNPVVILRLRENQYLGSTGIRFLLRYEEQLEARGGKLVLAGIGDDLRHQLERTGMVERIGADAIFYASDVLFDATEHALAYAYDWLRERV